MKFWELMAVCRSEPWLIERLAGRAEWVVYLEWYRDYDNIVDRQDRDKLDAELPDEACVHVLSESHVPYYEFEDHIRMRKYGPDDRIVTAVEILQRYGGRFLEDVNEAGLAQIPRS